METFEIGSAVSAMVPGRVVVGRVERVGDDGTVDVRTRDGKLYERVPVADDRVVPLSRFGLGVAE